MFRLIKFDPTAHSIWAHAWCARTNQLYLYPEIINAAMYGIKKDGVLVGFMSETPKVVQVWSNGIYIRVKP